MPWGIVIGSDDYCECSCSSYHPTSRTTEEGPEIREIREKLKSDISIIRESVEQSMARLREECKETVQRLEKDAAEKIARIKGGD